MESGNRIVALDPSNPEGYAALGAALDYAGRHDEALERFERVAEQNPAFVGGLKFLAATQTHLGRIDDAEWTIEEILLLQPNTTLANDGLWPPYTQEHDAERYIEGLRRAGIPE